MPKLLDNSHKITKDSQHWFEPHQKPQLKLRYANISCLPKSKTMQKLKEDFSSKPCHARFTYHEGIVSKYTKTFQEYINQSPKQQNHFPERRFI
ncbi:hypothetical protein [Candidatus Rhabdochlamydia porcellionis]|jgi:hypothetical protein|uniref:Uncharacterized protein n=1 Tax=Candidatus Rhabdochlamydia porcellionis TaxID=225148 RepID=A0ABX8YZ41_9BACT|nr:hypothetical protein [Candidatus Rhabdochlamydia porcellionis]QZA58621.1 hypothetical protein RHAB15C_0000499 [Candidatus Rhabdochlamydia porcellionis]